MQSHDPNGILFSARHSLVPNHLGYCGPDANQVLLDAVTTNTASKDLEKVLVGFQAAFPYHRFIAQFNGIKDPYSYQVSEAYWIGNEILEKMPLDSFYEHLRKRLAGKYTSEELRKYFDTGQYAPFPHHAVHVINAFSSMSGAPENLRNGNRHEEKATKQMDKCRIAWGRVLTINDSVFEVEYEPLTTDGSRLQLGPIVRHPVNRKLEGRNIIENVRVGDWISFHWDHSCSILTPVQASNLKKYTMKAIQLANTVKPIE